MASPSLRPAKLSYPIIFHIGPLFMRLGCASLYAYTVDQYTQLLDINNSFNAFLVGHPVHRMDVIVLMFLYYDNKAHMALGLLYSFIS